MLKGFVLGFICFFIFFIVHLLTFYFKRDIKFKYRSIKTTFYIIIPVYIILYFIIPADALLIMPADPIQTPGVVIGISKTFNFLLGIFVYTFLYFGYCQFYFIVDRSISVRVMIELENSKNKELSQQELREVYNPDYVFERRLQHMLENNYLNINNGKYSNTKKGKILAYIMKKIKDCLNLGIGG